jgi:hypothetical protein
MTDQPLTTLAADVAQLPDGHLYVTALAAVSDDFTVHMRGFQSTAAVTRLGNGASMVYTVTVVDKLLNGGPVATATLCGTQTRVAQMACGLLLGYAATQGVEGVMPSARSLRAQLND